VEQTNVVNIRRFFDEGRAYTQRNDSVQASEELYKAAEETVKRLAERFDLPQWVEASRKGRWTSALLFSAVRSLSEKTHRQEVLNGWHAAWFLHVEGFHEARLDMEEVTFRLPMVEELINLAETEVT